jgi:hypothetical protein
VVPSPNASGADNTLSDVAVLSSTNAWAVGEYTADGNGAVRTLIQHYDGTGWTIVPSPNRLLGTDRNQINTLLGVTAITSSDVWAVGYTVSLDDPYQTLTMHWNGTAWSIVDSPNYTFPGAYTQRKRHPTSQLARVRRRPLVRPRTPSHQSSASTARVQGAPTSHHYVIGHARPWTRSAAAYDRQLRDARPGVSAAEPVRHDQGMSTTRKLGWESLWVLVGFLVANSLVSLNGVRRGDVSETAVSAGGAVICAWLLITRRRLKRHPPSLDQATSTAFRVALGFSIVGLGGAVLFAIWAIRASDGERILWAIGADMLAAGGAFFVLFTEAINRRRSQRRLGRLAFLVRRWWQRGCAICGDDSNLYSGQLVEITRDEARAGALVRCPRCSWLYVIHTQPPREAIHINEDTAGIWFPAEYN